MKKLVVFITLLSLLTSNLVIAQEAQRQQRDKVKTPCQTSGRGDESILRVCNNVSDIICKDVKPEDRRSCDANDEFVFSSNTTKLDIYHFAKGCFGSAVTSFTQFFTDFIPDLLIGMWNAMSSAAISAYDYASGKKSEDESLWSKLKGKYESAAAVGADVYEAVKENPGAFFQRLWSKVVDVVGPMVASYDCLKPQKKVEGICGFVAGWVIPPAMLARVLVRGAKEIKFLKDYGTISTTEKGRLAKALEYSEKRSKITLQELIVIEGKLKKLGYSEEEFSILFKTGALEKFKIDELQPLTTLAGKQQRELMLGKKKVEAAAAATIAAQKAKAEAQAEATRQAKINQANGKTKTYPQFHYRDDFITIQSTVDGRKMAVTGQITERIIEDGKEVGYVLRMVNPVNGKVYDARFTRDALDKLLPQTATSEATDKVITSMKKQGKFKTPEEEFEALRLREERIQAELNRPASMDNAVVREADIEDFAAAQREIQAKEEAAKKLLQANTPKPQVSGVVVTEASEEEFRRIQRERAISDGAAAIESRVAQHAAAKSAEEAARIKKAAEDAAFKAKAARDGMVVDEIAPDDPMLSMFGSVDSAASATKPLAQVADQPVRYQGGIDFEKPVGAPRQIVKAPEPKKIDPTPVAKDGIGGLKTPYLRIMAKDSQGLTTHMPAQVTKTIREGGVDYYFIKVIDKTSMTAREEKLTLSELKIKYKFRESPELEKEVKQFYRSTGHGDTSVP